MPPKTSWNAGVAVAEVKSRPSLTVPCAFAARVKLAAVAVPPSLLVTSLTNLSWGVLSLFVIVQVAEPPSATVTVESTSVPPTHDHAEAVYPAGPPDSDRSYATPPN